MKKRPRRRWRLAPKALKGDDEKNGKSSVLTIDRERNLKLEILLKAFDYICIGRESSKSKENFKDFETHALLQKCLFPRSKG